MPTLQELPTELRRRIVEFAIPDSFDVEQKWPRSVLNLQLISQRLRVDVKEVIKTWPVLKYVFHPPEIKDLQKPVKIGGRNRKPTVKRLCLDVFHESDQNRIRWTCYCVNEANWTHHELVEAWAKVVADLPLTVEAFFLDITPAPAGKRDQHRIIINSFVHNKNVQNFLSYHDHDVGDLITAINKHYEGRVPIYLTGRVSEKSSFFLTGLRLRTELPLEFVGTTVTSAEARFAKIKVAVERIVPHGQIERARKAGKVHPRGWLREVRWTADTKWTYGKVGDVGEEEQAIQDLRALVEFKIDETRETLCMAPVNSVRRALQHDMAKNIGLQSASEKDGEQRHVVVRRIRLEENDAKSCGQAA